MPDIYTTVTEAPPQILAGLMAALELRAADPQQRAMLQAYLSDATLPPRARVLGCGTGRSLACLPRGRAWPRRSGWIPRRCS